jgi:hypothetical protein
VAWLFFFTDGIGGWQLVVTEVSSCGAGEVRKLQRLMEGIAFVLLPASQAKICFISFGQGWAGL